jgi:hypothetical protein
MMFDRKTQALIHFLGRYPPHRNPQAEGQPPPLQPALFMTVRREIAQSPSETGARSHEAGQHPAWEFRRGCAPFVGILQGG